MRKKEKIGLWEATRTLWIKFCGIADEYKMLRDRWLYLCNGGSLPTLPYLKRPTFAALNKLVDSLVRRFEELGFYRNKIENFEKYDKLFSNIEDLSYYSRTYNEIKKMFLDLATYVGLLKLAFFQRTVSSEISHVVSGVPHSPERTIGNELFYLAADKAARRYNDCLKTKKLRWDGVITFAPPKEMLHGAFFRPSYYSPLFHISMSEEQKYFVGTYLALAHEFGHASVLGNRRYFLKLVDKVVGSAITPHLASVAELQKDLPSENLSYSAQKCEKCPFYPTPLTREKIILYRDFFDDFLSDLIAIHIGGLNTAEMLFNKTLSYLIYEMIGRNGMKVPQLAFSKRSIVRMNGILSYLDQIKFNLLRNRLDLRFKNLIKQSKEFLDAFLEAEKRTFREETIVLPNVCINCILKIGELWGENIGKLDQELRQRYGRSIFTIFIKENMFFNIDKEIEDRITESLLNGTPCPQEDPRYILHGYYEAYKKSRGKKRPNYAATIHSIAFNEFHE